MSQQFPLSWFFIKNQNGYVLTSAQNSEGANIVIASLRNNDPNAQLWQHDGNGLLINKESGLVMEVSKGQVKAGSEIVQMKSAANKDSYQHFAISQNGHICVKGKPNLVLGIKESFFSRREGLHVHLQTADKRSKDQHWNFVLPVVKSASSSSSASKSGLKPSHSSSSIGSNSGASVKPPVSKSLTQLKEDDAQSVKSASTSTSSLDQDAGPSIPAGTFPDTPFFLKSQQTGLFIGVEAAQVSQPNARMVVDALRKSGYDSQLWSYDRATGHVLNKASGLVLSIEGSLKEDAYVCQAAAESSNKKNQSWTLSTNNEICLKDDASWVLGLRDSWFSAAREGAHIHIQKKNKSHDHQKFTVVMPIFKKKAVETGAEQQGTFPENWFFVKNQETGDILTTTDNDVHLTKLDTSNYSRQLWRYKNGFLINKASGKVLDVQGGVLSSGASVCQYDQKKRQAENQLWALTVDGFIYVQSQVSLVLTVQKRDGKSYIHIGDKKSADHKEQRWNFVLPVFKKKPSERAVTTTTTTTNIKKTVTYRYAQYPAGWFFIKSFISKSTRDKPFVLTANKDTKSISLAALDRENWQAQLWSYSSGALVNYAYDFAIDASTVAAGSTLKLTEQNSKLRTQRWSLSIDGYLVSGLEPSLVIAPQVEEHDNYKLTLADHRSYQEEHRWGLLIPEVSYRDSIQILIRWSVAYLQEWSAKTAVMKSVAQVASWPEGEFIINTSEGYALVPEKAEALAQVTVKKIRDVDVDVELFKWSYSSGYLVHVSTGLVLHADDLSAHASKLLLRSKLIQNNRADDRQLWSIKTNGSIFNTSHAHVGLGFTRVGNSWRVELWDTKKQRVEHYSWRLYYGNYESRYSEVHKRKILVIITWYKVILVARSSSQKATSTAHKVVTQKYGVFPKEWFFIRSRHDSSLVVTSKTTSEGAKLVLAKIDFKNYKLQMWRSDEDGCLVNMESNLVIDVAGGKLEPNSNIIQWHEKLIRRTRKNQHWGLSVEGHIHTESRPSLVIAPAKDDAKDGTPLVLKPRGVLTAMHQQWSFAVPVFGKGASRTIESVGEASLEVADRERFERIEKRTIIRRWGVFPSGEIFIRLNYGTERLTLTVEKQEGKFFEYAVTVRPLNFKEYKWQMWRFENGHLINVQTGLALDSAVGREVEIERGLKTPLVVHALSEAESQYWALNIEGEIHLKSNERMVIGVASEQRASAAGAQVGLRQLRLSKSEQDGKQQVTVHSEKWLRWVFSKPVFGVAAELKDSEEQKFGVEEEDDDDDDSDDNDDGDDDETDDEADDDNASVTSLDVTKPRESSSTSSRKSNRSSSSRLSRKDSFTTTDEYIPTGFEKVMRYKNHHGSFPPSGFFLIKSELHGYVLDVDGDIKSGCNIILTRLRSTDYASQLWSYKEGYLYNLKGEKLVLDATEATDIRGGERVHLSTQNAEAHSRDQIWEFSSEGLIALRARRNLVLSLKQLKHSDAVKKIDVFVQEEKTHGNLKNGARREQRWEILIPSLIPIEKTETGAKVIGAGKVEVKTVSTVTSMFTLRYLRDVLHYGVTAEDTWPVSKCFFIRFGADNQFLAAGVQKGDIGLYKLDESVDYKRFLWVYIDGYLINYKYMLRLVYLSSSRRWILSDLQENSDQTCHISRSGILSIRIRTLIYYLRIVRSGTEYQLDVSEEKPSREVAGSFEFHVPSFTRIEHSKDIEAFVQAATAFSQKQRHSCSTQYKTISTTIKRAIFPANEYFFIKVDNAGATDLVLAVDSYASGASLVVKKISFSDYKSQLWSYRDGLLYNFGSLHVINIQGGIAPSAKIGLHLKTNCSLKWFLTMDGYIRLQSHPGLALGYRVGSLTDGNSLILTVAKSSEHVIRWKFAVPVFSKRQIAAGPVTEQGTTVETLTEITTEVDTETEVGTTHEESSHKVIVSAELWIITIRWRYYLMRRLRSCRTKAQMVAVLEESRRILYQSLESHGKQVVATEEWTSSVEHIEKTFNIRLFDAILSKITSYKDDDEVSFETLDIQTTIDSSYNEIKGAVQESSSVEAEMETSDSLVDVRYAKEQALVTVAGVKVTVHIWFLTLYKRIAELRKTGASDEEIKKHIQESYKQLQSELTTTRKSVVESDSWSLIGSFHGSFTTILDRIDRLVDEQVLTISSENVYTSEEEFTAVIDKADKSIDDQYRCCHSTILGESAEVQKQKEEEKTTEKEVVESVSNELYETKTRITTWYSYLVREITTVCETKQDISTAKANSLVLVESAQMSLSGMLEQLQLSLKKKSLTSAERRQIEYEIDTIRTTIYAYLWRFRQYVETEELSEKSVRKYLKLSFGSTERLDIVEQFDHAVSTFHGVKTDQEQSSKVNEEAPKEAPKAIEEMAEVSIGKASDDLKFVVLEWYTRLQRGIVARVKEGGANVKTDVEIITAQAQSELSTIVSEKKKTCSRLVDSTTTTNVSFEEAFGWIEVSANEHIHKVKSITSKYETEKADVIEKELALLTDTTVKETTVKTEKWKASTLTMREETEAQPHGETQGVPFVEGKREIDREVEKIDVSATVDVEQVNKRIETPVDSLPTTKITPEVTVKTGNVAISTVDYVKNTVKTFLSRMSEEVSERASKGGENASVEIEEIVEKYNKKIDHEINEVSKKTENTDVELTKTIEWAKNAVKKTTVKMHDISAQAVSTGEVSKDDIHKKLTSVVEDSKTEIHTALDKHDDVTIEVEKAKVEDVTTTLQVGVADYVKSSVGWWYGSLKQQVADIVARGGTEAEVEEAVTTATATFEAEIKVTIEKTETSTAPETVKEQIREVTESAKKAVRESSEEIKAVGVEIIATGTTDVEVVQEKIECKTKAKKDAIEKKLEKIDSTVCIEVEKDSETFKKIATGVAVGAGAVVVGAGAVVVEAGSAVVDAAGYVKNSVASWLSSMNEEVSECAAKGGENAPAEIEKIVAKYNKKIDHEIAEVSEKTKTTDVELTKTIEWAKEAAKKGTAKVHEISVQAVATGEVTKDTIHKNLTAAVEGTKSEIHAALEKHDDFTIVVDTTEVDVVGAGKMTEEVIVSVEQPRLTGPGAVVIIKNKDDKKVAENVVVEVGSGTRGISLKKTTISEDEEIVIEAVSTEVVQKTGDTISSWFTKLVDKMTLVLETSDSADAELESLVCDAEMEFAVQFEKYRLEASRAKTKDISIDRLNKYFTEVHSSVTYQLSEIRTTITETQSREVMERKAALYGIAAGVNKQIRDQVISVKESSDCNSKKHKSREIQVVRERGIHGGVEKKSAVKQVDVVTVQAFKTEVHAWFAQLMGRLKTYYDESSTTVAKDQIAVQVTAAEDELEKIIASAKKSSKVDSDSSYGLTIDYVRTTVSAQLSLIKTVSVQESVSNADIKSQLDNIWMISNEKVDKAIEIQMSAKKATKVALVSEPKEQVQQRLKKQVELVGEECKVKIFGWYGVLIESLRAASHKEGVDIKTESQVIIEKSFQDLETIMRESKRKIVTVGSVDSFFGADEKITSVAVIAQTQALNSFDQIKAAVRSQALSLEQVFIHTEACEIEESLDYKLTLFKQRIGHSFEYAAGAAIAATFEGKTVTWVESTEMPESFAGVRAFAFDLVGTVTDHVTTVARVWSALIREKHNDNPALTKIDITAFALKWHMLFIERRSAGSDQSVTDSALLRLILIGLLKEHHVYECEFTDAEYDQLISVWSKLELFHDSLAGIGRIKKQSIQDTITVAFSSAFSTRTMINLARHGCLCWNAQFGADMFGSKTAESVISGVSDLLALNGPEELAVVSANADVLAAAKARGTRTVHIHRISHESSSSQQFDLEIDGIDMLAESYETMLEEHSKKTTVPAQRSWFQRVVSTASDAATAVQKSLI